MPRHARAAAAAAEPVSRRASPPLLRALADLERHHALELARLEASGALEDFRERMAHQIRERHRREREAFLRRIER